MKKKVYYGTTASEQHSPGLMLHPQKRVFTAWMIPLRYTSMDMGKSSPFRKSLPPSSALINPDRFFLARTRPSCWVVAEVPEHMDANGRRQGGVETDEHSRRSTVLGPKTAEDSDTQQA
ncbi:hypothetical protein MG293_006403 [Ovis ammon polii]|uniref:Uncharacterized protein n=1 Tax=Ovis ammon polii TaxID=230172 RepID=A0AAD4YD24_OVIAM|nr:hypothetical protein MG293_006403 [Ovis ammon polii]